MIEDQKKKILSRARRTSFSSSPGSNQMENYEVSQSAKVVELFDW